MMRWFEGMHERVVLVTGASSGIGRVTAQAFAAAGAHVALVARRGDALAEAIAGAGPHTGRLIAVPADVGSSEQVEAAFARTRAELGPIDVVVNNAGLLLPSTVAALSAADLDAMLRVNLFGALFVMQEAVRGMRPRNAGSIVNVASLGGRRGVTPLGGYCATKFALVGLTEALRTELHETGVHVGLVLPGVVDTPMVTANDRDPGFIDIWPSALNMPPEWVVWAIFASVRFGLTEISVPPGAATLEKLAALAPGMADALVDWGRRAARWMAGS